MQMKLVVLLDNLASSDERIFEKSDLCFHLIPIQLLRFEFIVVLPSIETFSFLLLLGIVEIVEKG